MPVLKNIAAIAKGMSITFMEMLQPTVVENYPDGPGPLKGAKFQERYRGVHVLQRDESGLEKCVACFLCAAACPSNCIYIEAAENTAENRVSGAERYAKVYNIDYNRCIFCGYCVEACPTDAITHGHGFEIATFNASNLVYRKEQMLAPVACTYGIQRGLQSGRSSRRRSGTTRTRELKAQPIQQQAEQRRSFTGASPVLRGLAFFRCHVRIRAPLALAGRPGQRLRVARHKARRNVMANDQWPTTKDQRPVKTSE